MRAATAGGCSPGLTATRKRSCSVEGTIAAATIHEVLAALPGRQQHAEVAEPVGGLGDLAQIAEIGGAGAGGGAEVPAVPMGRQEPEHVHAVRSGGS